MVWYCGRCLNESISNCICVAIVYTWCWSSIHGFRRCYHGDSGKRGSDRTECYIHHVLVSAYTPLSPILPIYTHSHWFSPGHLWVYREEYSISELVLCVCA